MGRQRKKFHDICPGGLQPSDDDNGLWLSVGYMKSTAAWICTRTPWYSVRGLQQHLPACLRKTKYKHKKQVTTIFCQCMNDMFGVTRTTWRPEKYIFQRIQYLSCAFSCSPTLYSVLFTWTTMSYMLCTENVPPSLKAQGGTFRRYPEFLRMVCYTLL